MSVYIDSFVLFPCQIIFVPFSDATFFVSMTSLELTGQYIDVMIETSIHRFSSYQTISYILKLWKCDYYFIYETLLISFLPILVSNLPYNPKLKHISSVLSFQSGCCELSMKRDLAEKDKLIKLKYENMCSHSKHYSKVLQHIHLCIIKFDIIKI